MERNLTSAGVLEAAVRSVAEDHELRLASVWMGACAVAFASTVAVTLGRGGQGSVGLFAANCVAMALRIAFSSRYLRNQVEFSLRERAKRPGGVDSIERLDADVISIEASKSELKLLDAFRKFGYSNLIGPGLYDIHSPRVPSVDEMKQRLADFMKAIPQAKHLYVNPDCGLKTRGWPEVERSLENLVAVAKWARSEYAQ
ncbi:hypothetical protein JCM11491_004361 [Sporobolomyces phaffii]